MKHVLIRGKKWKVKIARLPINNSDAVCDYANRTILISPSTKDKRAAMIHEILHACLPDLEELAICEIEFAILGGIKLIAKVEHAKEPEDEPG
jgi:hypothetical protein